jgi:hypothetical protein
MASGSARPWSTDAGGMGKTQGHGLAARTGQRMALRLAQDRGPKESRR